MLMQHQEERWQLGPGNRMNVKRPSHVPSSDMSGAEDNKVADSPLKDSPQKEPEDSPHSDGGEHEGDARRRGRGGRPRPMNRRRRPEFEGEVPENSKEGIRRRIWKYLEDNDLANFPRPVTNRIPNFKGSEEACDKAVDLPCFKSAKTVKVNPDKPQQQIRFRTLELNKTLLVPTPRLRAGLFNKITPPDNPDKEQLRVCATAQGVKEFSAPISLTDKVDVDLVITGSVAVSKEGYRIGKGEGFGDMEWAMMMAMGAVSKDTLVVTIVHDSQVTDIPAELMQPHDLMVDIIVTPTEIIECQKQPKPEGIIWSMLTRDKFKRIPILKKLREVEEAAGKDVRTKDDIEGPSSPPDGERSDGERKGGQGRRRNQGRRRERRPPRERESDDGELEPDEKGDRGERRQRRRRTSRRKDTNTSQEGGENGYEGEEGGSPSENRRRRNGPRRNRPSTSSVFVGNLPRSLRVSELKSRVREQEVQPLKVVWHGGSGHAFLIFLEKNEADEALQKLADLEIGERKVRVEMSNRGRQRSTSDGGAGDQQEGEA